MFHSMNSERNFDPRFAQVEDETVTVRPGMVFLNLSGEKPTITDQAEEANALLVVLPGVQPYTSNGRFSIGTISDAGASGENRPTTWAIGSWILLVNLKLGDHHVYTEFHGLIGRRTVATDAGPAVEASKPRTPKHVDAAMTELVQMFLYELYGNIEQNDRVLCDVTHLESTVNMMRRVGINYPVARATVSISGSTGSITLVQDGKTLNTGNKKSANKEDESDEADAESLEAFLA